MIILVTMPVYAYGEFFLCCVMQYTICVCWTLLCWFHHEWL